MPRESGERIAWGILENYITKNTFNSELLELFAVSLKSIQNNYWSEKKYRFIDRGCDFRY